MHQIFHLTNPLQKCSQNVAKEIAKPLQRFIFLLRHYKITPVVLLQQHFIPL
jgi:hypothetical protein